MNEERSDTNRAKRIGRPKGSIAKPTKRSELVRTTSGSE